MVPVYLRQTANELTGEHTCVMIKPINVEEGEDVQEKSWVSSYYTDFKKRMLNLLGYEFRALPCSMAFQFIGDKNQNQGVTDAIEDQSIISKINRQDLETHVSLFDLRRLDSYCKNMVDFHLILDLVPTLAKLLFTKNVLPKGSINLSFVQSAILIGIGL